MSNIDLQIDFIKSPYGHKYNSWASGVDELYALYENDFAKDIEEISVWHYRITCFRGRKFDFFPQSYKLCNLKTKKWHEIKRGGLKQFIKTFVDNERRN